MSRSVASGPARRRTCLGASTKAVEAEADQEVRASRAEAFRAAVVDMRREATVAAAPQLQEDVEVRRRRER